MSHHSIVLSLDGSAAVSSRYSSRSGFSYTSIRDGNTDISITSDSSVVFDAIAEHAIRCAAILREAAAGTIQCNPPTETEVDHGIG